ncbi:hypothetical protein [Microbacterium telephonicum]|nr:hypothetical protein [Microbacterium telephonicum]
MFTTDDSAASPRLSVAVADTLKQLPSRQHEADSTDGRGVHWRLIDIDTYEVLVDDEVVGFVDVVGAVFVALAGTRYAHAEERLQSLDFETAVASLAARRPFQGRG